jgi:hypothetical protein
MACGQPPPEHALAALLDDLTIPAPPEGPRRHPGWGDLALADGDMDGDEEEPESFRMTVELRPEAAEALAGSGAVAREVARALPGEPEILSSEPLFPWASEWESDPFGLRNFYRVRLLHSPRTLATSPWDLAAAARDRDAIARIEPDLPTGTSRDRLATAHGCFDSLQPPSADEAWSLRSLRVPDAWALEPTRGAGVRICHPDTGWTEHRDLDPERIDTDRDRDFIDGDDDATDPLRPRWGLFNPGHGTATGSVIMSGGDVDTPAGTLPPGTVTGVAPGATLVPIRAARSVVQIWDSDLARSVSYAVEAGCDVVSISLGGHLHWGLRRAVQDALHRGLIVVAAAGNCVGYVVSPASYEETIALAATSSDGAPWRRSSRGAAVTVAAPGEQVYRAFILGGPEEVRESTGTSYAAAEVAGVAALWLNRCGREIRDRLPEGAPLQERFRRDLVRSAEAPPGWDHRYGAGIVRADRLLACPPPSEDGAATVPTEATEPTEPTEVAGADRLETTEGVGPELDALARAFDWDPDRFRAAIARLLSSRAAPTAAPGAPEPGAGDAPEPLSRLDTLHVAELGVLAFRDPDWFEALLDAHDRDWTAQRSATRESLLGRASDRLTTVLGSRSEE